ncbi:MAG: PucR family transcriptional regulator ligand-binding domain-containing protein [bacterium]|nr:MAG: PucR family transcriptional regulator ligand-binding domain-containing protein [bacterium]
MTLREIAELLDAEVLVGEDKLDMEIERVCVTDLMSEALVFSQPGALLLTGLTNPQTVRTAEVAELRAVCFVRGRRPPDETIELAREKGIPLLCTPVLMYDSCGLLYNRDLQGCSPER